MALPSRQLEIDLTNPRRFRELAMLLITVQAVALSTFVGEALFPALVIAVAGSSLVSDRRLNLNRTKTLRLGLAIAVFFIVKHRVAPPTFRMASIAANTPLAHSIGQFLLVVQVGAMLIKRPDDRPHGNLPWLGVLTMLCAADVRITDSREEDRWWFQLLVLAFAVLLATYGKSLVPPGRFCEIGRRAGRRGAGGSWGGRRADVPSP